MAKESAQLWETKLAWTWHCIQMGQGQPLLVFMRGERMVMVEEGWSETLNGARTAAEHALAHVNHLL